MLGVMLGSCVTAGTPSTDDDARASGTGRSTASIDDRGPVGSMGSRLLGDGFPRVTLEIDSAGEQSIAPEVRDALSVALGEHGGKDVGSTGENELPEQAVYTSDDLRTISRRHRDANPDDDALVVHVLVLPGRFGDERALGVAFDASSFAIFPDRIDDGLVAGLNPDRFQQAVAVHELGHLFGLVNLTGDGGFHEDADHPGHSEHQSSVMFWAIEDISIGNVFRGGSPPTMFDDHDLREMGRIRG